MITEELEPRRCNLLTEVDTDFRQQLLLSELLHDCIGDRVLHMVGVEHPDLLGVLQERQHRLLAYLLAQGYINLLQILARLTQLY